MMSDRRNAILSKSPDRPYQPYRNSERHSVQPLHVKPVRLSTTAELRLPEDSISKRLTLLHKIISRSQISAA